MNPVASSHRHLLVTGGAGFVGSNLAIWFKDRFPDMRVTAGDNLRRQGSELNLRRLRQHGVEFVHCDIRNREDTRFDGRQFDLIFECSAEPSVLAGYGEAPDYVVNTNLLGTVNCLELARRLRADLVFLSTSRVYPIERLNSIATDDSETRFVIRPDQDLPGVSHAGVREDFPLDGARTLYGTTKLCSELLIQEYAAMYGLRCVINRCGVITGPWQMGKVEQGVFALWMAMHYFRRELAYIGWGGTGKQVRDLLHVEDLAELVCSQLEQLPRISGQTFNIGGGVESSLSLVETTRVCQEITGNAVPMAQVETTRPADVRTYITDYRKVHACLGWEPKRTARDALVDIYQWIRSEEATIRHLWDV